MGNANSTEDGNQMERTSSSIPQADPEDVIDQLQKEVAMLSAKCARLEVQNILVSVQQLDIAARTIALVSSAITLGIYFSLVVFLVNQIAALVSRYSSVEISWVAISLLKLLLSVYPLIYNRMTYGVTHRRFEVFAVAFIVISRTRLARWRERTFGTEDRVGPTPFGEECSKDAIWDANYEILARFLYISILRLKGLWTKSAQYLSSRADFVPAAYVRELKRLQDEAPATSWKDIKLPSKILSQLTDIEKEPIASASIGQVHVARMKKTGEKVVIKVQHPSSRTLITDDFRSLKIIARITSWMEPEYVFLEILMREWAKEARKELDFTTEAENLLKAEESMDLLFAESDVIYTNKQNGQSYPFQVEIPRPIMHLTSRDFLVMSFCEGFRVDDFDKLKENDLPRDAVMDGVAQAFSHMMYVTDIFNGDPHPGNIFIRPGTSMSKEGFTLSILDWGLAKRLPSEKRLAFCKMAYAAATVDFGMLLDSFTAVGLKMKRENVAEDMEGMRFFLRDIVPPDRARKRIKAKLRTNKKRMASRKRGDKLPMETKAYPGEFFFFIRVNELLHGLGSRMAIEMGYLDIAKTYAERGLSHANVISIGIQQDSPLLKGTDDALIQKLQCTVDEMLGEGKLEGVQIAVIDKKGECLTNLVSGSLGGLKRGVKMAQDSLVLGFSCTKGIAATVAHAMVQEGYLDYDEPVCKRVWPQFCPTVTPPDGLPTALGLDASEVQKRWAWKRQISLRHILCHRAGLWASLPYEMSIKTMSSCEDCVTAYEYDEKYPEATLLPNRQPGEAVEYHFMSFGWLVAGVLCGAYEAKHGKSATFEKIYEIFVGSKLTTKTRKFGFQPCGGSGGHALAEVVTSDVRVSKLLQRRREAEAMGEGDHQSKLDGTLVDVLQSFRGKEFLLDSRVWNCEQAQIANVPSAGGRFSALGLAHFYHELGTGGKILSQETLAKVTAPVSGSGEMSIMRGLSVMAHDADVNRTSLGMGYQLIRFDKDDLPSGFGHAGIGGSIGLFHKPSGLAIAMMTNKADGGSEVTMRMSRVVMKHFDL